MGEQFKELCNRAIAVAQKLSTTVLDFRVWHEDNPTPDIYAATDDGIEEMYNSLDFGYDFDCELFFNYANGAVSADHGVKYKNEQLTWY